jgi:hypothetical protein
VRPEQTASALQSSERPAPLPFAAEHQRTKKKGSNSVKQRIIRLMTGCRVIQVSFSTGAALLSADLTFFFLATCTSYLNAYTKVSFILK